MLHCLDILYDICNIMIIVLYITTIILFDENQEEIKACKETERSTA